MAETTASVQPKTLKNSYELPIYITKTMEILESLSPSLAKRFALRLFFKPLNFSTPEREIPIRAKAKAQQLQIGKTDFTAYEWGKPSDPGVILVHGWSGRATQFFKIIENLVDNGFYVVSFDAPGHGSSKQKMSSMPEFADAAAVCAKTFGPFNYGIAHSLGGMALLNTLDRKVELQGIVTIGTPDNIAFVVEDFCQKIHASPKIGEAIVKSIESDFSVKIKEVSTDYLVQKHNPRGLIIHDKEDKDVGIRSAMNLTKNWPNASLLVTEGLGHRKVLSDKEVINAILGFMSI